LTHIVEKLVLISMSKVTIEIKCNQSFFQVPNMVQAHKDLWISMRLHVQFVVFNPI